MTFEEDLERLIADRESERLRCTIWAALMLVAGLMLGAALRGC